MAEQEHLNAKNGRARSEGESFQRLPEQLSLTSVPTHLIVSKFLRLSSTFELYRRVLAALSAPDIYIPHELPPLGGEPDFDGLRALLSVFRSSTGLKTLVVSDPFKHAIIPMLDSFTPQAREIAAVNLVTKSPDGKLIGQNLDGEAFVLAATKELGITFDRRAMVFFGCGGVSSAVATRLAPSLSKAALIDVEFEKAIELREKLLAINPKLRVFVADRSEELDLSGFEYFYNGTGLGKNGANENSVLLTPLHAFDELPERGVAFDANYTPWETAFLRRFASMNYRLLNGFSHMIAFASMHLSMITGREVSYELVREHAQFAVPSARAFQ